MRMPSILLRDPQLIRQVVIKDFDSFVNRGQFFNPDSDPLLANSLFNLQGKYGIYPNLSQSLNQSSFTRFIFSFNFVYL